MRWYISHARSMIQLKFDIRIKIHLAIVCIKNLSRWHSLWSDARIGTQTFPLLHANNDDFFFCEKPKQQIKRERNLTQENSHFYLCLVNQF